MDMKKILENLESAEKGEKASASADAGSMKAILESFAAVEGGCGDPMPTPMPEPDKVRMNVNISAEGKDGIDDLLNIMKSAGMSDAAPVSQDMMPMIKSKNDDMTKYLAAMDDPEMAEEEEWDNAPEEEYSDHEYMIKDLAGGLNKEKKAYKSAQRGDNAMAAEASIKEQLLQALEEKKKGVDGKACWDGYKRMGTKKKGGKTVDNCVPMTAKEKNK